MARKPSTKPFFGVPFGWEGSTGAGAPIGFVANSTQKVRGTLVTDTSEAHVLVVAGTGTGKGRSVLIPTLLETQASAIVIDVKGEAAAVTARYRRSIGHEVHIVDPFRIITDQPAALNPLDLINRDPLMIDEDALEIAEMIVGDGSLRDRFWDNWARSLIAAMVSVVTTVESEEGSLANLWQWFHRDDAILELAKLLDTGKVPEVAHGHIAGFLGLSERDTRPSVLGTVQQHIRIFRNPIVRAAMSKSSFDLDAIRDGRPLTVYLVIPPDKIRSHSAMLRLWLWAIMSTMIRRRTNPSAQTMFLIDEMGHLGAMPLLEDAVTLMRGYGVRMVMFLQHLNQLAKLYPENHLTIASNCGAIATFGVENYGMARSLADLFGDVSTSELLAMPEDEIALKVRKQSTRRLTKLDYLQDTRYKGKFDTNPRYGVGKGGPSR
jgi:type IV secretion system protein VirD4